MFTTQKIECNTDESDGWMMNESDGIQSITFQNYNYNTIKQYYYYQKQTVFISLVINWQVVFRKLIKIMHTTDCISWQCLTN